MRFHALREMKLGGTTKSIRPIGVFQQDFFVGSLSNKHYALIAQSVEQRTENPCVAGSIPAQGTSMRRNEQDISKSLERRRVDSGSWHHNYNKRRNNYGKVKSFNFIQSIDTSNCACFYLWFFPCGEVSFCCAQLVHVYYYCEKFIKKSKGE